MWRVSAGLEERFSLHRVAWPDEDESVDTAVQEPPFGPTGS